MSPVVPIPKRVPVEVETSVHVREPHTVGLWLAGQPADIQAAVLLGFCQGLASFPGAQAMLQVASIAECLADGSTDLAVVTEAQYILDSIAGLLESRLADKAQP